MTDMQKKEFISFLNSINSKYDDLDMIRDVGLSNESNMRLIVDYIKNNDIDLTHLWEDNEEGYKAHDKYEGLVLFAAALDNYGLDEE